MASGRPRDLRPLLIPALAFVAVLPLMLHGCSCGHDFDFHLLSWIEAATQFAHGNLHPQWTFTPAWNAGEPRFVFYPPISWTLGAVIGLILSHLPGVSEAGAWTATPIVFTWIALTAAGLTLYRLARAFASPNAALIAACLYVANPYMLFTAYERTAYAELLAAAWIPLLLLAILRPRPTATGIALPVALLWLTNAPAAVMGTYTLAALTLYRLATASPGTGQGGRHSGPAMSASGHEPAGPTARVPGVLTTSFGTALGLAIAAFYILPAAVERRFVQMSMAFIAGMRIDHNFLFEHTGTTPDALLHDAVLHTASTVAVSMLAATALALATCAWKRGRVRSHAGLLPALTLLTAGVALLLTPLSLPLWTYLPEASLLQFPWRILALLGAVLGLSLAIALDAAILKSSADAVPGEARSARTSRRLRQGTLLASEPAANATPRRRTPDIGWLGSAATCLAAVALISLAYSRFHQRCDSEDNPAARVALFHSSRGTDPTDEYTPAGLDNELLDHSNPPSWLGSTPEASPALPGPAQAGPAPSHLSVSAAEAGYLILNRRDFPTWRIVIGGRPVPQTARPRRIDGLIVMAIPAGTSTIDITPAHPPDQILGDAMSAAALVLFGLLKLRR